MTLTRDEKIKEAQRLYVVKGMSLREVGEALHTRPSTVHWWLQSIGVEMRSRARRRRVKQVAGPRVVLATPGSMRQVLVARKALRAQPQEPTPLCVRCGKAPALRGLLQGRAHLRPGGAVAYSPCVGQGCCAACAGLECS